MLVGPPPAAGTARGQARRECGNSGQIHRASSSDALGQQRNVSAVHLFQLGVRGSYEHKQWPPVSRANESKYVGRKEAGVGVEGETYLRHFLSFKPFAALLVPNKASQAHKEERGRHRTDDFLGSRQPSYSVSGAKKGKASSPVVPKPLTLRTERKNMPTANNPANVKRLGFQSSAGKYCLANSRNHDVIANKAATAGAALSLVQACQGRVAGKAKLKLREVKDEVHNGSIFSCRKGQVTFKRRVILKTGIEREGDSCGT